MKSLSKTLDGLLETLFSKTNGAQEGLLYCISQMIALYAIIYNKPSKNVVTMIQNSN